MGTPRLAFLDSNVLVYAYSDTDPARRDRARALADLPGGVISSQVLSELANVLLRRGGMQASEVRGYVAAVAGRCEVVPVTLAVVLDAFRVKDRYRLGFYDSQIIAAALAAGASTLYSEDLHHGLLVDGVLRVLSPFRAGAEQPAASYRVRRARRKAKT